MSTTNSHNMFYFSLIDVKQEIDIKVEASEEEKYIGNNWQPKVILERLPLAAEKKKKIDNYWQAKVTLIDRSRGSRYCFREKR